jgi:hypothetical protein
MTTTPPTNEAGPSSQAEMVFPHIVNGTLGPGSFYSTEFIVFSGTAGQSSTGNLRFFKDDGSALDLNLIGTASAILPTCLPAGTGSQAPPQITPVTANTPVPGANVWLFVVDDGSPQPAVSAERPGSAGGIVIGRINLANPGASINWQFVATPADTGGRGIADHWHVFAHGHHWIAFSAHEFPPPPGQAPDRFSYLLKMDTAFRRVALIPVVFNSTEPTNDMFLVAEPDGVAVSVFMPSNRGLRLYRFDTEGRSRGSVTIGGGQYAHGNGSSALPLQDGYLEFATETLQPNATSSVKAIVFDPAWQPQCAVTLIDESGTNAAMPSGVRLANGTVIVNMRIITGVTPRGLQAPFAQPSVTPDSGAIQRLVVMPDGTVVSRETILERTTAANSGNRPHTALIGDRLITTWDTGGSIWLRIDRISLN